jgi:hypothetical protein
LKWCFVHAPTDHNGWSGEIVLVFRKLKGKFKMVDIHKMISHIFPDDDPDMFDYDLQVPAERVKTFFERKKVGKMQRMSAFGTFEELYYDEWEKTIIKKYPDIYFLNSHKSNKLVT